MDITGYFHYFNADGELMDHLDLGDTGDKALATVLENLKVTMCTDRWPRDGARGYEYDLYTPEEIDKLPESEAKELLLKVLHVLYEVERQTFMTNIKAEIASIQDEKNPDRRNTMRAEIRDWFIEECIDHVYIYDEENLMDRTEMLFERTTERQEKLDYIRDIILCGLEEEDVPRDDYIRTHLITQTLSSMVDSGIIDKREFQDELFRTIRV